MQKLSLEDREELAALLTEYDWRIDHGENVGSLFVSVGRVLAPGIGLNLSGRDAITSYFSINRSNTISALRHTWCSLRIQEATARSARFNTTQITYLRMVGEHGSVKHMMVGDTHDAVERDNEGQWRFVERRLEVIFPFDLGLP
jgi:hypothetical protein